MISPCQWTIGIVTTGMNAKQLKNCVGVVLEQYADDQFAPELIVVGGESSDLNAFEYPYIHVNYPEKKFILPTSKSLKFALRKRKWEHLFFKTGDISGKKNLIARISSRKYLLIIHDYFSVEPLFFERFRDKPAFDVAIPRILNFDGTRFRDFTCWDHPLFPENERGALLPYEFSDFSHLYISGGVVIVDKSFFLRNPFDRDLFWGEGEDVEWSLRIRKQARFLRIFEASIHSLKLKPNPLQDEGWRRRSLILNQSLDCD